MDPFRFASGVNPGMGSASGSWADDLLGELSSFAAVSFNGCCVTIAGLSVGGMSFKPPTYLRTLFPIMNCERWSAVNVWTAGAARLTNPCMFWRLPRCSGSKPCHSQVTISRSDPPPNCRHTHHPCGIKTTEFGLRCTCINFKSEAASISIASVLRSAVLVRKCLQSFGPHIDNNWLAGAR